MRLKRAVASLVFSLYIATHVVVATASPFDKLRYQVDLITENTWSLKVIVYQPVTSTLPVSEWPVMIFFRGFYPRIGSLGYDSLARHIASKGVTVVVPLYNADARDPAIVDIVGNFATSLLGSYSSRTYAWHTANALSQLENKYHWKDHPWVIYGHSVGARVALSFLRLNASKRLPIKALMSDGIPARKVQDPRNPLLVLRDHDALCDSKRRHQLSTPLLFVLYVDERDRDAMEASRKHFECVNAHQKLKIEVRPSPEFDGARVDHFSPMSDDPDTAKTSGPLRKFVDQTAGAWHRMPSPPTFSQNLVDELATRPLLVSLAFAYLDSNEEEVSYARRFLLEDYRAFFQRETIGPFAFGGPTVTNLK